MLSLAMDLYGFEHLIVDNSVSQVYSVFDEEKHSDDDRIELKLNMVI